MRVRQFRLLWWTLSAIFFCCVAGDWGYTRYLGSARPSHPRPLLGQTYPLQTQAGLVYVTRTEEFVAKYGFAGGAAIVGLGVIALGFYAVLIRRVSSEK